MNKKQMFRIAIGLIAIPVLAACSSSGDQDSAVATSVAATVEAQPPTAAPPTAVPPTPVPTEAPLPTAIPSNPAAALGDPTGKDSFDNDNNWTLFNNDCFATTIAGGKFVMEAKGAPELSCWEVS